MQADHHRLSRLWHRFIQQTHASDGFFSCVLQMCTATKDMSCIIEKKKAGGGAMFDPNTSVQSIIHGAAWGSRQEKGTGFEIRWRVFGKNKNWVGPSGDQKKFELSSCLETTWQGINIKLKEVVGSNRERFRKVYTWRLAREWTASRARSLESSAEWSELLFRGTCMLQLADSTRVHQQWRLSVGANQTIDAFPDLKHLAKEVEVQARQHGVAISQENFEKFFSYFYSESNTNPRVLTQAVWFFTTCHFGLRSREVDWVTWRLPISSFEFSFWFKGHEQLHSAAMKRGWWFFMPKNLGLIADLCSLRDRENVWMTSRSCMNDILK